MCHSVGVPADKDILYRVAYDEAVRALSEQQAVIDSFRSRAGLLFSSTAVTTSFLGAQFLDGGLGATTWAALAAFVGVAATSLAMLWPQPWEFTANPQDIIKAYIDEPAPIYEIQRELSFHMHNSYVENRAGLRKLALFFQVASGLLTLEVLLWIISLAAN
jgi:hypothetical protein